MPSFGRPPSAGRFPRSAPRYTLAVLLVSLTIGYAVGQYRYTQANTLQQYYLPAYIRSAIVPIFRNMLGGDGDTRLRAMKSGSYMIATGYSGRYEHAAFHQFLRDAVYQTSLFDLVRQPLYIVAALFVLGLLWSVPRDVRRSRERRQGRRNKGPELVTVSEFNRRTAGDGLRIVQEK